MTLHVPFTNEEMIDIRRALRERAEDLQEHLLQAVQASKFQQAQSIADDILRQQALVEKIRVALRAVD